MNLWTLEDLKSQIFIFFKQTDNIGNKQNGICFHDRLIDISLAQNCLTNWCFFLLLGRSNDQFFGHQINVDFCCAGDCAVFKAVANSGLTSCKVHFAVVERLPHPNCSCFTHYGKRHFRFLRQAPYRVDFVQEPLNQWNEASPSN
jgi:hypothetical protein